MTKLASTRETIGAYVETYNTTRLHSALNYLTPWDYLQGTPHVELRLKERRRLLDEAREERRMAHRQKTIL